MDNRRHTGEKAVLHPFVTLQISSWNKHFGMNNQLFEDLQSCTNFMNAKCSTLLSIPINMPGPRTITPRLTFTKQTQHSDRFVNNYIVCNIRSSYYINIALL